MSNPPDFFYNQAAALPIVETEDGLQVVIISTRKGNWTLPKGVIEPGDSPHETAAIEAWEEAGIEGEMELTEFTRFQQQKWGGTCTIRVYKMKVTKLLDEWPEQDVRLRKTLPFAEALELVVERQKTVLEKLLESLH